MKVAMVGAGSWGTTLAMHLSRLGHEVTLWVYEPDLLGRIRHTRVNDLYLPGFRIPEGVLLSGSLEETVRGAEAVVLATPSHVLRAVLGSMRPHLSGRQALVSVAKGIETDSLMTMSQVVSSVVGRARFAVLSGPSFAREVAEGLPTAVTIASREEELARRLQSALSSKQFRAYAHHDVIGTELGGAVKNVIAIAAGISDGLGFGLNARAALITRGLSEMTRLGIAMGADAMTFGGLSGNGDLILTCTGDLSRNRGVGLRVGRGEGIDAIRGSMTAVAEGILTTRSVRDLARRWGVEMPITEQVYQVLYGGKDPGAAVADLMTRPLKREILFAGCPSA
jgi:glycerol-3-phosphate dehydrogenase (NAD(P)+)